VDVLRELLGNDAPARLISIKRNGLRAKDRRRGCCSGGSSTVFCAGHIAGPYQQRGVDLDGHSRSVRSGGILADDMGLGKKTLQFISGFAYDQQRSSSQKILRY